jgi:hypothetical protein
MLEINADPRFSMDVFVDVHSHSNSRAGFLFMNPLPTSHATCAPLMEYLYRLPKAMSGSVPGFQLSKCCCSTEAFKAACGRRAAGLHLPNTLCYTFEISFFNVGDEPAGGSQRNSKAKQASSAVRLFYSCPCRGRLFSPIFSAGAVQRVKCPWMCRLPLLRSQLWTLRIPSQRTTRWASSWATRSSAFMVGLHPAEGHDGALSWMVLHARCLAISISCVRIQYRCGSKPPFPCHRAPRHAQVASASTAWHHSSAERSRDPLGAQLAAVIFGGSSTLTSMEQRNSHCHSHAYCAA